MERMNILVSTNDNYVMPLAVLLQSMFDNHDEPFDIWFMWSDLSEENRGFFKKFAEDNGSSIEYIHIDEQAFKGLPTREYISRETYFRLLAAEHLPAHVEKILWLDADMVVNGNIRGLYDLDISGHAVAACPHGEAMRMNMRKNCLRIGIKYPEQYFNAGVMLCNLKRWREMDISGRIKDILSIPRDMKFPGQDLTNLIFNGEVMTQDWELYNCMTHSILPEDADRLKDKALIIHYAGKTKPWAFNDLPFSDVWMEYYKRSPFGSERLKLNSYFRMKAMAAKFNRFAIDSYFKMLYSRFSKVEGDRSEYYIHINEYCIRLVFSGMKPDDVMLTNLKNLLGGSSEDVSETVYIWKDDLQALVDASMLTEREIKIKYHSSEKFDILLPALNNRLSVRDKNTNTTYIIFPESGEIPVGYQKKPFINEIAWWISDTYLTVHSALVGTRNKGALILGVCGSGKSTLAMSCLSESMQLVSEDYTFISREGPITGSPSFYIGNVPADMMENFPGLSDKAFYHDSGRNKYLIDLNDTESPSKLLIEMLIILDPEHTDAPSLDRIVMRSDYVNYLATTPAQIYCYQNFAEYFSLLFERFMYLPEYRMHLSADTAANARLLKTIVEQFHEGDDD